MSMGQMIADQVEKLLRAKFDLNIRRNAEKGIWPATLWDEFESLGLNALLMPEAHGGLGGSWEDALPLLEMLGRFALPLPIGETAIAALLIADHGMDVPAGPLAVAVENKPVVIDWGRVCGTIAQLRTSTLVLLAAEPGSMRLEWNIGRDPRDIVEDYTITASAPLRPDAIARYSAMSATLRTCQIAGALEWLRDTCVEYAATRKQFGKMIGQFQAVQQLVSQLAAEAAAAHACAGFAAAAIDRGAFEVAVSSAKLRANVAARKGASLAHQILGAIGFTDEHELHHYTRRLWAWRVEHGSERHHANRLGRAAIAAGDDLWAFMTAL